MREQEAVGALIERIVGGARIPSRAKRDALRRELWSHFEDAGASPEALRQAIRRFGAESTVTESLRRSYRTDFAWFYLGKIGVAIAASAALAMLIQLLARLRLGAAAAVSLAPGLARAVGVSLALVLALVAAWEATRRPFGRAKAGLAVGTYALTCLVARLLLVPALGALLTASILAGLAWILVGFEGRLVRILPVVGVFAAALYAEHRALGVAFEPPRALLAGALLAGVWLSTVRILARVDRAFVSVFEPRPEKTT